MPIYEYICHSCGNEFEQLQGWSDSAPSCSVCSSDQVSRRMSPPAIHFKGSGWYITDSKNGQKGKNGANGVAGTNGSGKESSEKGDAKESASESGSASKETPSESKSDTTAKAETSKVKAAE